MQITPRVVYEHATEQRHCDLCNAVTYARTNVKLFVQLEY